MFVKAIDEVRKYVRAIHTITRSYNTSFAEPGAATLFFVNELGTAITCKHVANLLIQAEQINKQYEEFKKDYSSITNGSKHNKKLNDLEKKFNYRDG